MPAESAKLVVFLSISISIFVTMLLRRQLLCCICAASELLVWRLLAAAR